MRTLQRTTFDDWVRAVALVAALVVVGWLAVFGNQQIAPLAAGALIGLLGAATSYLFRGRVEKTTDTNVTPTVRPPTQPPTIGPAA